MTSVPPGAASVPPIQASTGRGLTRRSFLTGIAVSGFSTLLASCSSSETSTPPTTDPGAPPTTGSFAEPEVLTSADGLLEVVLRVEETRLPAGDSTRVALTYNGLMPGPTLRVRPGDRLRIRLENRLAEATNLHTHGLHVSPEGDSDNVFVTVEPGEDRTYVYDIPGDHRSGLFWYHPHAHGSVAGQVARGLAGAIVVVDDVDDSPELADSNERIWVLADPPVEADGNAPGGNPMERMIGREGGPVLVNGVRGPEVRAEVGRLERWRLVNASASRYHRLAVDDHDLHLIATDGGRLPAPVVVSELLLAPGERSEVLITPRASGTFAVRSLPYDRGGMGMGGMGMGGTSEAVLTSLATMTVAGTGTVAAIPETLPVDDDLVPEPSAGRVIELGMGHRRDNGAMVWTIDGRTFDPERTDIEATLDTVEVWEIRNRTGLDHPFHLHVWPFLVLTGEGSSGWKDTVNVPAGSLVRIVVPFTGITGRTVYHCHILDHEDVGMMGIIETRPR